VAAAQLAAALAWATPLDPGLARPLLDACAESPAAFAALRSPEAWAVHAPWAERMAGRYSPAVYERLLAGRIVAGDSREAALAVRRRLEDAFAAVWARHDFLVMPATPCVAPALADCTPALRARLLGFTVPASLAALPVLTLPVPVRDGLSTGLQIIAPLPQSPAFLRILERLP
jgi:amidase/aspartyl-tRNA(Asn)/glutamyl-tRNA(Gln) amidotransferase subunit A